MNYQLLLAILKAVARLTVSPERDEQKLIELGLKEVMQEMKGSANPAVVRDTLLQIFRFPPTAEAIATSGESIEPTEVSMLDLICENLRLRGEAFSLRQQITHNNMGGVDLDFIVAPEDLAKMSHITDPVRAKVIDTDNRFLVSLLGKSGRVLATAGATFIFTRGLANLLLIDKAIEVIP